MLIKDLEIMRDISSLFEKTIIIWGMGKRGHALLQELDDMGAGKKGIILCDSDSEKWGERPDGTEIVSPRTVQEFISLNNENKVIVCVTITSVIAQNEVLKSLDDMNFSNLTVYTQYAIKWGIYLNVKDAHVDASYRNKMLAEHEKRRITYKEGEPIDIMKYFTYAPLHNDEMILIYQPGKVGSRSLYWSIKKYGKYVLHSHRLTGLEYGEDNLLKLMKQKSAKVISLVREPISRQISVMWENIHNVNRYSSEVDFTEIEQFYLKKGFENQEFKWFFRELEKVFDINIYEHSFDRENGYSIIKKNNIELLLMKVEKLNGLETVIGEFLNIPDFTLQNTNIAKEKSYRFAYQEYLKEFILSKDILEHIYYENEYMKFFYTDEEIDHFYLKWLNH